MSASKNNNNSKSKATPALPQQQFLHPKSRKVAQMTRNETKKIQKVERVKIKSKKEESILRFFQFWKNQIEENPKENKCWTNDEMRDALEEWLKIKYTQNASKLKDNLMEKLKSEEMTKYQTYGLEIPDLAQKKTLALLLDWNGSVESSRNIPMKKMKPIQ